jgi:dTDP-4-amino-4,6-dideoxygalactose transaminase
LQQKPLRHGVPVIWKAGADMKLIKVAEPCVGEEEVNAVKEVILSGRYISGAKVAEFEREFANYVGVEHAVAVNSGTAALHVALAVLDIGFGDEVIVPPLTFFSTVAAVLHQNGTPVFADIDPESYCLDLKDIEKKISRKTKVIIPVHLYGNSAEMDEIMHIAQKHGLRVIEDAAQAHGTEYRGRKVGSLGDIGCFSFFATKHITTGEGGMLVTNNKNWADVARMIRSHGMSDRDHHDYLGYNYRMNEMAAAMGTVQLKKLDGFNKKRIENSLYLIDELNKRNIPWLKTPKLEKHTKHTFFWCPILIDEKKLNMTTKQLIELLRKEGVETRNRYWEPLYKQKILADKNIHLSDSPAAAEHCDARAGYSRIYLENAENVAGKIIGLPNHVGLAKKELDCIVNILSNIK